MRTKRSLYKRLLTTLAICTCFGAVTARADEDATTRGNRMAYGAAMKCFVTNGIATGERRDAGDEAEAVAYEATARRSFDVAVKLGQALGYSNNRVNQDFQLAQVNEMPKLVKDSAYFQHAKETCKQLGLM